MDLLTLPMGHSGFDQPNICGAIRQGDSAFLCHIRVRWTQATLRNGLGRFTLRYAQYVDFLQISLRAVILRFNQL